MSKHWKLRGLMCVILSGTQLSLLSPLREGGTLELCIQNNPHTHTHTHHIAVTLIYSPP